MSFDENPLTCQCRKEDKNAKRFKFPSFYCLFSSEGVKPPQPRCVSNEKTLVFSVLLVRYDAGKPTSAKRLESAFAAVLIVICSLYVFADFSPLSFWALLVGHIVGHRSTVRRC